jgi:hypothetical protein
MLHGARAQRRRHAGDDDNDVRGTGLLSRGRNRPGVFERAKLCDRSDVLPRRPRRRRRRGCRRLDVRDHVREGRDARLRDGGGMSGRRYVRYHPRVRNGWHLPSRRGTAAEGRGGAWLTGRSASLRSSWRPQPRTSCTTPGRRVRQLAGGRTKRVRHAGRSVSAWLHPRPRRRAATSEPAAPRLHAFLTSTRPRRRARQRWG